jgi:hypothetical protein
VVFMVVIPFNRPPPSPPSFCLLHPLPRPLSALLSSHAPPTLPLLPLLQDSTYARGRKDFARDLRGLLDNNQPDPRRAAVARELSTIFEAEWVLVERAADSQPARRPVQAGAAAVAAEPADAVDVLDVMDGGVASACLGIAATTGSWRGDCHEAMERWIRRHGSRISDSSRPAPDVASEVRSSRP